MIQSRLQGRLSSRRSGDLGEDVNPSAYIVNLADCMLVLACGFMVAMMAFWGIDLSTTSEISEDDMEMIDANVVPEDLEGVGSNFLPAGTVYYNPATDSYYILKSEYELDEEISAEEAALEAAAAEEAAAEAALGVSDEAARTGTTNEAARTGEGEDSVSSSGNE